METAGTLAVFPARGSLPHETYLVMPSESTIFYTTYDWSVDALISVKGLVFSAYGELRVSTLRVVAQEAVQDVNERCKKYCCLSREKEKVFAV